MRTIRDYITIVTEKVTLNPDGSVPPTQTVNGVTMNAPNTVQGGWTDSSGNPIRSGSGQQVGSGSTPAPAAPAPAPAARDYSKYSDEYLQSVVNGPAGGRYLVSQADAKAELEKRGKAVATPVAPPADTQATPLPAATAEPAPGTGPATGADMDVATQDTGAPAPAAPAQAAQAAPANRDSMTFGKAFADARKAGEKTFMWKGKSYATAQKGENPALDAAIAKKAAAAQPAPAAPKVAPTAPTPAAVKENVGYSEDQSIARIISLVNYR